MVSEGGLNYVDLVMFLAWIAHDPLPYRKVGSAATS
jgi:hypothetical protein